MENPEANVIEGSLETYALLEVIGRGAYGVVYKGIGRDGSYVAVKRVGRAKLTKDEKKQLQEEISLLRKLNDNHIVKYVEAVDDPRSPYLDIVMEYVEGGSLYTMVRDIRKSLVDRDRVLGETHAAMFIRQVVIGLRYLHRQGVVHSDIKGANILVTKDKCVKLADFGLASTKLGKDVGAVDEVSDNSLDIHGSPYWMAPEIVTQTGKSTASDIWSVGCTVIELLTGFPPNHQLMAMAAMYRLMNDECPPLPSNISPECESFLRRCFVTDMKARATADELLQHRWLTRSAPNEVVQNAHLTTEKPSAGYDFEITPGAAEVGTEMTVVTNGLQRLEMYEEDEDDDDFGDIDFDDAPDNDDSVDGNESSQISHQNHASSHVGRVSFETSDDDPFRHIMEDPEAELERERKRRQKELWEKVKAHVRMLGKNEAAHVAACEALVDMFSKFPEQRYNLIYDPGLLPILDVLESQGSGSESNPRIAESMLRVTLSLVESFVDIDPDDHPSNMVSPVKRARQITRSSSSWLDTDAVGYFQTADIPHDLCLAGFLPAVMQYCEKGCSFEARCLAARFLEHMLAGESTTHMFIACRGYAVFVRMLEDDVLEAGLLNRVALSGIERMLSIDNQRHKRDFCRRFVSAGLLPRLAQNISHTMALCGRARKDRSILFPHILQLAKLLQTFAARADPGVKAEMTAAEVLNPLMSMVTDEDIPRDAVQSILGCIRDISRDPQTHAALQEAGAIERLVTHLSSDASDAAGGKPRHYIVSTLHNLCIVSAARQEAAVTAGLVPHLIRYIRSQDMNLRALCVDIYSGLANASHRTRVELLKHDGVDVYVELLEMLSVPGTVRKWQARVLQAISVWLEDVEQAKAVEARLVDEKNCVLLCKSLAGVGVEDVEGVLEPYWRLVNGSTMVNEACGRNDELVSAMVSWLDKMYASKSGGEFGGPRGRLLLLRTLLAHARRWEAGSINPGLVSAIRVLLQAVVLQTDESIMVREQASLLLEALEGK